MTAEKQFTRNSKMIKKKALPEVGSGELTPDSALSTAQRWCLRNRVKRRWLTKEEWAIKCQRRSTRKRRKSWGRDMGHATFLTLTPCTGITANGRRSLSLNARRFSRFNSRRFVVSAVCMFSCRSRRYRGSCVSIACSQSSRNSCWFTLFQHLLGNVFTQCENQSRYCDYRIMGTPHDTVVLPCRNLQPFLSRAAFPFVSSLIWHSVLLVFCVSRSSLALAQIGANSKDIPFTQAPTSV